MPDVGVVYRDLPGFKYTTMQLSDGLSAGLA